MGSKQQKNSSTFWERTASPAVGSSLTILSGLCFLFLCMILPLVGKAGVQTEHARLNLAAFTSVLLLTIAVAGLAIKSKLDRSRIDGSPFPVFSAIIGGLSVVLFLALITGLLKI